MDRLTESKILLVVRSTRLANLRSRFATKTQAKFYVSRLGGDFEDYEREDATYQTAIAEAQKALGHLGRVQLIQREFLPNFVFGKQDIVVALGQDGLVANTLKYLDGQPLVGVNPDPKRYDGQLLPFSMPDLPKIMREVVLGHRGHRQVTMAEAQLNTGLCLYAVNDFFIGLKSHGSARYRISSGNLSEQHSSSGVIVSTGLGSTGWYKSVMTGAHAIAAAAVKTNPVVRDWSFPWDAQKLRFSVREPFPSSKTGTNLVYGEVTQNQHLSIESLMGEHGVIFSDGIESDFLEFNAGTKAKISVAARQGCLVV